MTDSKRFAVQIIPEAGLDEKYNATIRIREAESSFSQIPHLVNWCPWLN